MNRRRVRITWVAVMCAAALTSAVEAEAQTSASAASSAANSANMGTGMGMGMGMGFMPMAYGMFGSPTPSPTDAAALGMPAQSRGIMGMGGPTTNPFTNPMAAPLLYGSMFPMTQQQAGLMMLAGQSQMLGIGSGRLSGVRAGPGTPGAARGRQALSASKSRGSAGQPGGLAARYFNRTAQKSHIPQGYYNRQNRYYPQVGR